MATTDQTPPELDNFEPENAAAQGAEEAAGMDHPEDEFDTFIQSDLGEHKRNSQPDLATAVARVAKKWATGISRSNKGNGYEPDDILVVPSAQHSSAALQEALELSEALGALAAATPNTLEAMGLMAAAVPVIVGLEPYAYRALWIAIPALVRGVMGITKSLHQQRTTRPYIKDLPEIIQNAVEELAQLTFEGPLSKYTVAEVLAHQTKTGLAKHLSPQNKTRRTRQPRSRYDDYEV